ncbi:DUF433 domain-containing protein [Segeticoccus rhizosphaerae]|uniref:DUF433 domain-containing protein n=1 Tax=Segeticoccus rhizosphaerae TaxID=1104777 RepID=UPI0012643665|nr:DUF433 domain-containing protein [Segeticoccus rhizosphaerae]
METLTAVDFTEPRFTTPILTVKDIATLVDMPIDTAQAWAGQRRDRPQLFTRFPQDRRGWPSVPLIGLAEASSLRALKSFLPPSEVAVAARYIKDHADRPHALASQRLVTDGATAYVEEYHGESVTRLRDQQTTIVEVFRDHLRPLVFLEDEFPIAYKVPQLPGVEINPNFNAGRMSFRRNRVPVFAVAGSLLGGDSRDEVEEQYRLTADEVLSVERQLDWLTQAA